MVWRSQKCTDFEHTQKCTAVKLQHVCSYVHNGGNNIRNIDTEYRLSQFITKTFNKFHINTYILYVKCQLNQIGKTESNPFKNGESNQVGNSELNRVINGDQRRTDDADGRACVRLMMHLWRR